MKIFKKFDEINTKLFVSFLKFDEIKRTFNEILKTLDEIKKHISTYFFSYLSKF